MNLQFGRKMFGQIFIFDFGPNFVTNLKTEIHETILDKSLS
jgi:hypothetical protein